MLEAYVDAGIYTNQVMNDRIDQNERMSKLKKQATEKANAAAAVATSAASAAASSVSNWWSWARGTSQTEETPVEEQELSAAVARPEAPDKETLAQQEALRAAEETKGDSLAQEPENEFPEPK